MSKMSVQSFANKSVLAKINSIATEYSSID